MIILLLLFFLSQIYSEFFYPEYCDHHPCYNCTQINRDPRNCDACKNMWGPLKKCNFCHKGFNKSHDCNICAGKLTGVECNICEACHSHLENCGIPGGYYERCENFVRRKVEDDDENDDDENDDDENEDEDDEWKKYCVEVDSNGNYGFIKHEDVVVAETTKQASGSSKTPHFILLCILAILIVF